MPTHHPRPGGTAGMAAPLSHDSHPGQTFTLYAAQGRVYARNVRGKLVDLGTLTQRPDGWAYRLDGDGRAGAGGFADAEQALADIAGSVTFLYLGGQFTALQDLGEGPDVRDATQILVTLDPRGQAGPVISADV